MTAARSPSTVDLAAAATQAIRELNHRTQHPDALTKPAQLDRIVAELAAMVAGLPQLLRQLAGWLVAEQDAGRIRSDNHLDPGRLIDQAAADLAHAGHTARRLGQLLDTARQHTAHLGARSTDEGGVADRAGIVANRGHIHGHQRAGLMAADGQISMSLDAHVRTRLGTVAAVFNAVMAAPVPRRAFGPGRTLAGRTTGGNMQNHVPADHIAAESSPKINR